MRAGGIDHCAPRWNAHSHRSHATNNASVLQRVEVAIAAQVATTTVEQSYHNTTDHNLEAEYIFPLPAGTSVRDFSMWVDGKRYKGEAVDAGGAARLTKISSVGCRIPACSNTSGAIWKMRIYPVPRGASKRSVVHLHVDIADRGRAGFVSIPAGTGQAVRRTEKDFTMVVRIESPHALGRSTAQATTWRSCAAAIMRPL